MKTTLTTLALFLLAQAAFSEVPSHQTIAQDLFRSGTSSPVLQERFVADSLPAPLKPRLLPANMSFVERALWDEDGIFRGMGIASPLTAEGRKSELTVRRTMLSVHQVGGFVTLGCMVTAVWYGQHTLDHPLDRSYRRMHQTFVTASIISYSATGLLAVLSPPPVIRRDEVSTTTIHKTLAWVHFIGMVATPILGSMLSRNRQVSYDQVARFHQVSAYITTAALAGSMIVITLK